MHSPLQKRYSDAGQGHDVCIYTKAVTETNHRSKPSAVAKSYAASNMFYRAFLAVSESDVLHLVVFFSVLNASFAHRHGMEFTCPSGNIIPCLFPVHEQCTI